MFKLVSLIMVDICLFQFLEKTFLGYLDTWKKRVAERKKSEGLTATEANKMFLALPTYNGILLTG